MHWKEKVLGSWKIVLDVIVFDVTSTILGLVFLLSLFYFIYLFIYLFFLSIKKAPKCKTNNFHPLKKFCAPKKLLLLLFFVRLILLVGFGLICIFYAQNLFVKKQKKKINRHEIVLITSNAILLMLIPIGHVTLDVWWS